MCLDRQQNHSSASNLLKTCTISCHLVYILSGRVLVQVHKKKVVAVGGGWENTISNTKVKSTHTEQTRGIGPNTKNNKGLFHVTMYRDTVCVYVKETQCQTECVSADFPRRRGATR